MPRILPALPLLCIAPLALAAELHVSKTGAGDDGLCDNDCSLREALRFANAQPGAHRIHLPPGTYVIPAAFADGLPIRGDISIVGSGTEQTVLDGQQRSRLFRVEASGRLLLEQLSLVDGLSPTAGGALLNHGRAVLDRVDLRDNKVQVPADAADEVIALGGAIANHGELALLSAHFDNNGAYASNRSQAARGGALYNASDARLVARNTIFSGNTATSAGAEEGWGGALCNEGHADLTRSAFVDNQIVVWGFGSTLLNLGTLRLTNSTLSESYSFERGSALVNGVDPDWPDHFPPPLQPARLWLENVTIANNYNGGLLNHALAEVRNSIIAGNYFEPESGWQLPLNCEDKGTLQASGLLLGHSQYHSSCQTDMPIDDALTFSEVLGPLVSEPGSSPVHPLLPGSPAIDTAVGNCPRLDQRLRRRPQDGDGDGVAVCDLGAYELAEP